MTIPSNREHLDDGSGSGCRVRGLARQVINEGGTTRKLVASESGALCVFNVAANQTYTLPAIGANDLGMWFDFVVTVTSSGSHSVDTDSAATFIGGGILVDDDGLGGTEAFLGNIASDVSIDLDSAKTGWQAGGYFRVLAFSTTAWTVGGYVIGVGAVETPFA